MRPLPRRWVRRVLVIFAVMICGVLFAAPSCNVSIQFDAFDLLFGGTGSMQSPS